MPEKKTEENPFQKAVICVPSYSKFGIHRTIRPAELVKAGLDPEKVDPKWLSGGKRLLEHPSLEAIQTFDSETKGHMDPPRSIPFPLAPGMRLIPVIGYSQMDEYLKGRVEPRRALVEAACEVYPTLRAEAQKALGPLYSETDYPSVEGFRARYSFSWTWLELSAPGTFRSSDPALFEEQQKALAAGVQNALELGRAATIEAFGGIVDRFTEILTPGKDGKRKRVHDSLLGNALQFFEAVEGLGAVTDLGALMEHVQKLRKLLAGVDIPALKENAAVRERVLAGAVAIQKGMSGLVTEAHERRLVLNDD